MAPACNILFAMMHATPAEIEVLISNIHMAELAGNWKEENKQSLFVIIQIGKVYVRSSIQRRVDTGATWEDEILKLRISKEHWSQPEALMTILVQHDQQQASFPKVTLILCAMLV